MEDVSEMTEAAKTVSGSLAFLGRWAFENKGTLSVTYHKHNGRVVSFAWGQVNPLDVPLDAILGCKSAAAMTEMFETLYAIAKLRG